MTLSIRATKPALLAARGPVTFSLGFSFIIEPCDMCLGLCRRCCQVSNIFDVYIHMYRCVWVWTNLHAVVCVQVLAVGRREAGRKGGVTITIININGFYLPAARGWQSLLHLTQKRNVGKLLKFFYEAYFSAFLLWFFTSSRDMWSTSGTQNFDL